jgi:hypothetical protein
MGINVHGNDPRRRGGPGRSHDEGADPADPDDDARLPGFESASTDGM